MKDWFDTLEAREQLFVGVGAVVVLVALFYVLAWSPLDRKHAEAASSVANWQQSLAELRPLKGIVQKGNTVRSGPATAKQSPIIIVDQTLRSRGLEQYRRRSQPTSSNGIRVEFENVAFDDLILWLGDLADQYAMHVQSGSIATGSRSAPGRINATLTMERAP
ncbi:MAG: type II secretion system protein M [Gammaproteobacteria bacterium]|nr:type II secretion system protein M [Gammaproteobacteria bacterium]